ncbi:Zinc knuckle CX2CX4HX4C [Corchorus capsularis]|uniref:Zinc knuckle CX2CX4HX4C n=1 Tax=Corchorus capsularis TaxID=210143 RepID=A0A1R3I5T1_COCAP|nr:Zinc knuckle CX2CX4HX4C [Corchorus capsularis]
MVGSLSNLCSQLSLQEGDQQEPSTKVIISKEWIDEPEPWSFQRSLLLLNDYDGYTLPKEVVFDAVPLWDVNLSEGRYLQICVEMDIKTPIQIGTRVTTPDGEDINVKFKYEKTPNYYRVCGILVHKEPECPTTIAQKKLRGFVIRKFFLDLKAESSIIKLRGIDRLGSPSFSMGSFSSSKALSQDRRSAPREIKGGSFEIISRLPDRCGEQGSARLEEVEVTSTRATVGEFEGGRTGLCVGMGSNSVRGQGRKWKKVAKVSSKYGFEALYHDPTFQLGKK